MNLKITLTLLVAMGIFTLFIRSTGTVYGCNARVDNKTQEFTTISISTNPQKEHLLMQMEILRLETFPYGTYTLTASFVGYTTVTETVTLNETNPQLNLNFNLDDNLNLLDEIVLTGSKTNKRQTNSPVIVGIINSKTLNNVQACNLSEGLRFQPGLRVETNCQTCNYTQLRMNGLAGGYSQILINGRPIFSPLTGLYGLEQLPNKYD